MKNNGSALRGGLMVRLGCGLLALIMLLGLLFAGGVFAYADNEQQQEDKELSAVDTNNGFYVAVRGKSVPADTATLVLKPVSDTVLTYATNGRTLSEDEFFLMYDLCFEDIYTHEEIEVDPDFYHVTVYFTAAGECFGSIAVTPVGGTLGELETKAKNKLDAEAAAEAEKAAEEAATDETVADTDAAAPVEAETETDTSVDTTAAPVEDVAAPADESAPVEDVPAVTALTEDVTPVEDAAPVADTEAATAEADAEAAEADTETGADAAEPAEGEEAAPAEEEKTDRNLTESPLQVGAVYNGNSYVTFNTNGLGILKFTGTTYNINDLPATEDSAEDTAEPATLYDRLMACETLDEVNAILDNLTEAEEAEMDAFTEEQNAALTEKMDALGAYGVDTLENRSYTMYPGGTQAVSLSSNWYTYSFDSYTSNNEGITVEGTDDGYIIKVGDSVKAGTYTLTVKYTREGNVSGTKSEITDTVIVTVKSRTPISMETSISAGSSKTTSINGTNLPDDTVFVAEPAEDITVKSITYEKNKTKIEIEVGADVPAGPYVLTSEYGDTIKVTVTRSGVTGDQYSQGYYTPTEHVAWDVVANYYGTKPTKGMDNAENYVESVKMANIGVDWADSDLVYPYNGTYWNDPLRDGQTLSTYFGTIDKNTGITLSITPKQGYYVTGFWIVCCNDSTPYNCAVLKAGNEFHATFKFSDTNAGAVECLVQSQFFGHPDNRDDQYFILVSVAQIPTPLYVEYDYGIIKDKVSNKSIFTTPTNWTSTNDGNAYGTGIVDTANTQYRYAYTEDNPAQAADWKHYANAVTTEAKQAAAYVGYYFAGWKVEYYSDADRQNVINDPNGKNYNYNLSGQYGSALSCAEGAEVRLIMHCKLIAQWKPIELSMSKLVSGLDAISGIANKSQTYKLTLQKQNSDGTYGDLQTVEYTITGDNALTYTFGVENADITQVITPGKYKVVEIGDYTINGESGNAFCEPTYPIQEVEVKADGTVAQLTVLNTFTDKAPTAKITVQKITTGNMYSDNDVFTFSVSGNTYTGDGSVDSFNLKNGETKVITVNVGDTITVEEKERAGYTSTSYVVKVGENPVTASNAGNVNATSVTHKVDADATIIFTNDKTVTLDTGVSLDSLPYILILGVVAVGAVVIVVNRRKHRRDY